MIWRDLTNMAHLIEPHGGTLINRQLTGTARDEAMLTAAQLQKIPINNWTISDLELIGIGAFSPLEGFMKQSDYQSVLQNIRLTNGFVWSIPIVLPVQES